jgi:hypothetical protein
MDYYELLVVLHVLLMGYWLGSELVAEGVWRSGWEALSSGGLPRERLCRLLCGLDHHPWNALLLNIPVGFTLAAQVGLVWLGDAALLALWCGSLLWLLLAGYSHRWRPAGERSALARIELGARFVLALVLVAIATRSLLREAPLAESWLAWKVLLLGAVVACSAFVNWQLAAIRPGPGSGTADPSDADRRQMQRALLLARAGRYLALLLVLAIGWLGLMKPG